MNAHVSTKETIDSKIFTIPKMEKPDMSSVVDHATPSGVQERVSRAYPTGQGDIILTTIDNTAFYVYRAILRHSSHVFETILENGEGDEDSSLPRLKIEASASTLEHLLAFAHPNKHSPSIQNVKALAAVFRAAKRYEMDGVLQQLQKGLLEVRMVEDVVVSPLYIKAPLAVLVISYAFECMAEGRFALRECIKGSLEEHVAGATDFDIPAELLSAILRLRQERMEWYTKKIDSVQWGLSNCHNCPRRQSEWRLQTLRDLQIRPNFKSFRTALSSLGVCTAGHSVTQPAQTTVDAWTAEGIELEETLPNLPHFSR